MSAWRSALHAVRVDVARLRHLPALWLATRGASTARGVAGAHELAAESSPLRRAGMVSDERLQAGKARNVAVAAARIDGIVLAPGATFSYHRAVGWPAWRATRSRRP